MHEIDSVPRIQPVDDTSSPESAVPDEARDPNDTGHDDFDVEAVVRWRMGAAYDNPILDWRSDNALFDRPAAYWQYVAGCLLVTPSDVSMSPPPNDPYHDPWTYQRLVNLRQVIDDRRESVASELSSVAPDGFGMVVTAQDAVPFRCLTDRNGRFEGVAAQVCPSRTVRPLDAGTTVLWSHPYVFRWNTTPENSDVPWEKRSHGIFWRGQLTGHSYNLDGGCEMILHSMRHPRPFLSSFIEQSEEYSPEEFDRWARTYQRLRATILYRDNPDIDIRLTDPTDERGLKLSGLLNARLGFDASVPRIPREAYDSKLMERKLRLAIPGNDIPSSIRSDLLSDSALLMPKPYFEDYHFFGLKPGKHYIEVAADLSDLPETIQWCSENDDVVREIALEGQRHAARLLNLDQELDIQKRILLRIAQNVGG